MSYLPLFIKADQKKCLIIGGGEVVSRKLPSLIKANLRITIVSPSINDDIKLQIKQNKDKIKFKTLSLIYK